jgi:hypothetical protein
MSELSLQQLRRAFSANGATRAYAKRLAPNDNNKNQVYVGRDFGVLNILPSGRPIPGEIAAGGKPHFKAALNFWWMSDDGSLHHAPGAQLILYSRHEEVRLSGYLTGVDRDHRPSQTMGDVRTPERVLFLAVRDDGAVLAYAANPESVAARELRALPYVEMTGVFVTLTLEGSLRVDTRRRLLLELCRVSRLNWITSTKLSSSGSPEPYNARNGGGYTLEAQLGVRPNGYSDPDFLGWEVKQFGVRALDGDAGGRITLMTPEPTGGFYATMGVVRFIEKYGYPDRSGTPNRLNFGGIFREGAQEARTQLTMRLLGYDKVGQKISDPAGGIALIDAKGNEAAVWRYSDLMSHWNKKHAQAAYVPCLSRVKVDRREYSYGAAIRLGLGTSFNHFLGSLDAGAVFFDPGMKVENWPHSPKPKKRSQFRAAFKNLPALYDSFLRVDACARP